MLVLAGWSDVVLPPGAWTGTAGERPLALIPQAPARGEAPVAVAVNEDHTVRAVLVGRLYNRRELRASLGARHAFSGRDDAEILVHLYEERGIQLPKALRGTFAFALWDVRSSRLLLARDQLGIVPLFYAADHGRCAAAAALPPLLALPGVVSGWDPAALDAFLALGSVPPPATLYPAVRQLAPGELAVWEDGRLRVQRYWQLTFPERRLARADTPALLRTHVAEALQLRQAGSVHGLLLSGGLGAASILAIATAERRLPVRAYTAGTDASDGEPRAAAQLAARVGLTHVQLATPEDWSAALDTVLAVHGGPAGGAGAPVLAAAARRAAQDQPVALAGLGGDEVFGGAAAARVWAGAERFRTLPTPVREVAELWARFAPPAWAGGAGRIVVDARLAPLEVYRRVGGIFEPEERQDLLTPDALAAIGDARPWGALAGLFADAVAAGAVEPADALHYVALTLGLPARATVVADAAAAGLELRLPLADHRLAQLVASVPAASRASAGGRQLLLRAALATALPRGVLARPHRSPAPPPAAWTRGPLRTLVEEELSPGRLATQGVFRPEHVAALWAAHQAGRRDHGERLWAILLATRWLARPMTAHAQSPVVRAAV